MSDLNVVARIAAVASTTSAKTLLQIVAPANQRLKVSEIGIGFHGATNTDVPITVDLVQQSSAGTASTLALVAEDQSAVETVQSSALQTFTAEPAPVNVIRTWSIHPQQGGVIILPIGREIKVGGGKRLGLRVTATSASVNVDAYLRFEE